MDLMRSPPVLLVLLATMTFGFPVDSSDERVLAKSTHHTATSLQNVTTQYWNVNGRKDHVWCADSMIDYRASFYASEGHTYCDTRFSAKTEEGAIELACRQYNYHKGLGGFKGYKPRVRKIYNKKGKCETIDKPVTETEWLPSSYRYWNKCDKKNKWRYPDKNEDCSKYDATPVVE